MTYEHLFTDLGPRMLTDWRAAVLLAAVTFAAASGCSSGTPPADASAAVTATHELPASSAPSSTSAPRASAPTPSSPSAHSEAPTVVERPTGVRDELVDLDGTFVHVRCEGAGSSTVVLIAGHEASSEGWVAVQPEIASRTRVCSYDRPGTGTSGPPAATTTFAGQAADLHRLLDQIDEPGPYVVVGHSFGGAEAVEFADRYRPEVSGLVLVDASPVDWPDQLCAVVDDGTAAAVSLRALCDSWADPQANVEHVDVLGSMAETADVTSLGSIPTTVLTAAARDFMPDTAAAERTRLTDAWDRGQQRWATLSSVSRLVTVADTSHAIQLDQPQLVVDEIVRLLP